MATPIYDGTFVHADTTPSAGTPGGVLDATTLGAALAWNDVLGKWQDSGNLLTTTFNGFGGYLLRPAGESTGDQTTVGYTAASINLAIAYAWCLGCRYSASGNGYHATVFYNGAVFISKATAGSPANLLSTTGTVNRAHQLSFAFSAAGTSTVTLTLTINDLTAGTSQTFTATDSTSPYATGLPAVVTNGQAAFSRIQTWTGITSGGGGTTFSASPSSVNTFSSASLVLTGVGTSWNGSTPFAVSGVPGASIGTPTGVTSTSATLPLTTLGRGGALTITDGSGTTSITIAVPAVGNAVFDGDSLTQGYGASSGNGTVAGTVYPAITLGILGPAWSGSNVAVTTRTIDQLIAEAATKVDTLIVGGKVNLLLFMGGSNNTGDTPAVAFGKLATYCLARKAAGWTVVVSTIPPRTGFDTFCAAFNALILSGWRSIAAGVADTTRDYRIGASGSEFDLTYFQADNVHRTDAGYAIHGASVAEAAAQALDCGGSGAFSSPSILGPAASYRRSEY